MDRARWDLRRRRRPHPPQSDTLLENAGFCPICDRDVVFSASQSWLRDHYLCSDCRSIPRERALMVVIDQWYPQWRDLAIHESSPGARGTSVRLAKECRAYSGSHYFPDLEPGSTHSNGWRNEDLENLTFNDESFDLFVSQDVMEHILAPDRAFAEIARVLRPGGAHIFTVPLVRKGEPTRRRAARLPSGQISNLLPAEYHGNPISDEGSLVTMDWGYDICEYIQRVSGLTTTLVYLDDVTRGIRAEYIEVLVSRKPIEE